MRNIISLLCASFLLFGSPGAYADSEKEEGKVEREARYISTIETRDSGVELTKEEEELVSELASQIMRHTGDARYAAAVRDKEKASREIAQARKLVGIIREMLPVTTRVTSVKNQAGKMVYHETEEIREELIPIFQRAVGVKVVTPLVDVKKDEAKALGRVLSDAELYDMSLWVDLKFVNEKLLRAEYFLGRNEYEKAKVELTIARSEGVKLKSTREENPLLRAMEATTLAEENLKNGLKEGARANLLVARTELETYKALFKRGSQTRGEIEEEIDQLNGQIEELAEKTEKPGLLSRIGQMTQRLFSRFGGSGGQEAEDRKEK